VNLLQLALDGIALGSAYALVAAGFVLTLNASRAVNFAHGDLVMVGGFAGVVLMSVLSPSLALPGLVILLLVLLLLGMVGLLLAGVAFLPLRGRPVVAVFVSTIAVGIILQNAATAWFGAQPRVGPSLVGGGLVEIAGLRLGRQGLAVIAVAAIAYAGLYILLAKTQLGRRLRAAAQDPAMAEALGIPVTRMILTAFALSAALAGAAGVLLSNSYFVSPTEGANLMLKAYIAATIGGWGRLHGAALGALFIGLFETVAATLAGPVAAEAMLYVALLAVLAFKPSGLFGEQAGSRA
jgi:branched-chain amino acid transport system permease protein